MSSTALDFQLLVGAQTGNEAPVRVLASPAGEASATLTVPFDDATLADRLLELERALLAHGGDGPDAVTPGDRVRMFGTALFDALFTGEIRSLLDRSRDEAARRQQPLRIQLRFESADLAALPWELLHDDRRGEFLSLSRHTPITRYVEMAEPQQPLAVRAPLRMLAMVSSPSDLPGLDVAEERRLLDGALAPLVASGDIELHWLAGQSWRDLQAALVRGPWHIFHFIGHGTFDKAQGEGVLALCHEDGAMHRLSATALGILLGDHDALRLVLLNACDGARTDRLHLFSSTATVLVRRGTPAVLAMQHKISDDAAIELSRTFYATIAAGSPVDGALAEARKAVAVGVPDCVQWGTPVLYLRAPDGRIFDIGDIADKDDKDDKADKAEATAAAAAAPEPSVDIRPRADVVRTTGYFVAAIKAYPCALGYGGVSAPGFKREGDGTVPGGKFHLRQVLYRPDRRDAPVTKLPVRELRPDLVWCDDPACPDYNTLVSLPHPGSYEPLWRDDAVYDLLAVVGYNDDPVVPGAGSAIFVHIARPGLAPTVGCVGLAVEDLVDVLQSVGPDDLVTISAHPDLRA